jgi:hypothetical protein
MAALDQIVEALVPEWPSLPPPGHAAVSAHCARSVRRQIALSPAHIRFGLRVNIAAVLACVMIVAIVLRRYRPDSLGNLAGLPSALMAYARLRGAFFMIYLPGEPLINSPAVALAHLLIVIIPFTASRFPAKQAVLVAFAILLFLNNGMFMLRQ